MSFHMRLQDKCLPVPVGEPGRKDNRTGVVKLLCIHDTEVVFYNLFINLNFLVLY